ncbi:deoxyribonucleoside regulator [Propionibacterium cyclohexanicum]|uniref:Deoxyribonucleoside regulator n=1 Tax=Propionibacterium cyclohexanicum TaxID=64702 RepID=A0A1H9TRA7_9ACTN|nr:sugar-binding domain-containing protein [Propionibacterium cyclohexanicum]SER99203.1 deoxyribonucleoside regulator [Propionibacterium cyclohexanicum]
MRATDNHEEQMLRAAELYYYQASTQSEIADKLGVTRWTVGRLLDEARKTGLVRIVIDHPRARRHELEVELRREFGLREVMVLPSQHSPAATMKSVCSMAAEQLCNIRPAIRKIAVSWGRTTAEVAANLPQGWARDLEVIQTNGGPSFVRGNPIGNSLHVMAESGGGTVRRLEAPTILEDAWAAKLLRADRSVAATFRAAESCRVMLFSPGSMRPESVLVQSGYLSVEQMDEMRRAGAVGDVMSHFITPAGTPAAPELDDRTLSIPLSAVRSCANSIAVAAGVEKAECTRAVVLSGLCTTLIVDSAIAKALLSEPPKTHEEESGARPAPLSATHSQGREQWQ